MSEHENVGEFELFLRSWTAQQDDNPEVALTRRIVARILRIAEAQTDPHAEVQAFRRGLLIAAGEAKVEHLFEPDDAGD